ncbi:MAG: DUF2169 domain-containing protein [Polyangiaceae bacterium]|nr:DUF2169 domain-containing protein [Polyangiaceae bacterium]
MPVQPLRVVSLSPAEVSALAWHTAGETRVTVVLKATFRMVHDGAFELVDPLPVVEKEVLERSGSVALPCDLVPFLPRADVIVRGHACAPPGQPVRAMTVRVALYQGRWVVDKSLHVYGDRRTREEQPAPFQRVPIVWERAFGGPSMPENPVGVGAAPGDLRLPNLVDARDAKRPGGLSAVARSWPVRRALITHEPALAGEVWQLQDGFPFRYFHAAPADQQVEHLVGNEWLLVEGMHPEHKRFSTRLPGIKCAAMRYKIGSRDGEKTPVAMVADMLVVDMDRLLATITFRGHFTLEGNEAPSVYRVFAGLEIAGNTLEWPDVQDLATPVKPALKGGPAKGGLGSTVNMGGDEDDDSQTSRVSAREVAKNVEASAAGAVLRSAPQDEDPTRRISITVTRESLPSITDYDGDTQAHARIFDPETDGDSLAETRPIRALGPARRRSGTVKNESSAVVQPPEQKPLDESRVVELSATDIEDAEDAEESTLHLSIDELKKQAQKPLAPFSVAQPTKEPRQGTASIPGAPWAKIEVASEPALVVEDSATTPDSEMTMDLPASALASLRVIPFAGGGGGAKPRVEMSGSAPTLPRVTPFVKPGEAARQGEEPDTLGRGNLPSQVDPSATVATPAMLQPTAPFSTDPALFTLPLPAETPRAAHYPAEPPLLATPPPVEVFPPVVAPPPPMVGPLAAPAPILPTGAAPPPPVLPMPAVPVPASPPPAMRAAPTPAVESGPARAVENPAVESGSGPAKQAFPAAPAMAAAVSTSAPAASAPSSAAGGAAAVSPSVDKGGIEKPNVSGATGARQKVASRLASGESLRGIDLSNADLRGMDLHGANLENATLRGAILADANLSEAQLSGADMGGADLRNAVLKGADLRRAELTGCDLTSADLTGAKLVSARLVDVKARGARFDDADLTDCDVQGGEFTSGSFKNLSGARSIWTRCDVREADFSGANLDAANWERANCTKTNFAKARLSRGSFLRVTGDMAILTGASLVAADLRHARFCGALAEGADFRDVSASKADLSKATLTHARFEYAQLRSARLREAVLSNAVFEGADLRDADLEKADLRNATRAGAKMQGANLRDVVE